MGHISSEQLAGRAGVNAAKVRKDLSYLGSHGVRGVGYEVEQLRYEIRLALGLTRARRVAIIGIGNLGRALATYPGFRQDGFRVVGLFDNDPAKMGQTVADLEVESVEDLVAATRDRGVEIGVITTPADAAQEVADALAAAGVRSILNFSSVVIRIPEGVDVRRVDLATEIRVLGYHLHRTES
jgi:redox-sensing transcriptional repressor